MLSKEGGQQATMPAGMPAGLLGTARVMELSDQRTIEGESRRRISVRGSAQPRCFAHAPFWR
jgi:hypothetical protein